MKSILEKATEAQRRSWIHTYTDPKRGHKVTCIFRITKRGQIAVARRSCSPYDIRIGIYSPEDGVNKARARMRECLDKHHRNTRFKKVVHKYECKDPVKAKEWSFTLFEVLDYQDYISLPKQEATFVKKNILPKIREIEKAGGSVKIAAKAAAAKAKKDAGDGQYWGNPGRPKTLADAMAAAARAQAENKPRLLASLQKLIKEMKEE